MTFTVEELQLLVGGNLPEYVNGIDTKKCIAYLARRVIAAERMADAADAVLTEYYENSADDMFISGMGNLSSAREEYAATK